MEQGQPRTVDVHLARKAIAGVTLLLSAGYLWLAVLLPFGSAARPGPGIFPVGVGVVLVVASIVVLLERRDPEQGEQEARVELPGGRNLYRLIGLFVMFTVYAILAPILGFAIATFIVVSAMVRILSSKGWLWCVAIGAGVAVLAHVTFVEWLRVTLPSGPFF